jgi:hypothetical protein
VIARPGGWPIPTSLRIQQMLDGAGSRLQKAQTKLTKAKKELAAHKDVMKRSRYTAEGYKKATAKLHALEKKVAVAQKEVDKARMLAFNLG